MAVNSSALQAVEWCNPSTTCYGFCCSIAIIASGDGRPMVQWCVCVCVRVCIGMLVRLLSVMWHTCLQVGAMCLYTRKHTHTYGYTLTPPPHITHIGTCMYTHAPPPHTHTFNHACAQHASDGDLHRLRC